VPVQFRMTATRRPINRPHKTVLFAGPGTGVGMLCDTCVIVAGLTLHKVAMSFGRGLRFFIVALQFSDPLKGQGVLRRCVLLRGPLAGLPWSVCENLQTGSFTVRSVCVLFWVLAFVWAWRLLCQAQVGFVRRKRVCRQQFTHVPPVSAVGSLAPDGLRGAGTGLAGSVTQTSRFHNF
jgi:hypothetical protein